MTPTEQSLVRFATPYLEVETRPTSSEHAIGPELARAGLAAKRTKRKGGDAGPRYEPATNGSKTTKP